jgi:hypothetical protein
MSFFKLPKCEGYGGYDAYTGDSDFECGYPRQDYIKYDDGIEDCNDCICSWKTYGGRIDPRTNKKFPFIIAVLLYGLPNTQTPKCGNCYWVKDKLKDDGRFESAKCPMMSRYVEPEDGYICSQYRWKKIKIIELTGKEHFFASLIKKGEDQNKDQKG